MKLVTLMLGLSLALGCVVLADEAATKATKATKTKATKTKATKAAKTKAAKAKNADTTAK